MIFVDTSAWYALYAERTETHSEAARRWVEKNRDELLTTDYIVDELLTLLRSRGERQRAVMAGEDLWNEVGAVLHYVTPADLAAAWDIFRRYDDKFWSFTDCTSRAVMERLGMTKAFAFDAHFRQFEAVTVVP